MENTIKEIAREQINPFRSFYIKDQDDYVFCLWKKDEFIIYSLTDNIKLFEAVTSEIDFDQFKKFTFSDSKNILDYIFSKFRFSYEEIKHRKYYTCTHVYIDIKISDGRLEMADTNEVTVFAEFIDHFNNEFYAENKIDEDGFQIAWSGIQNRNLYQWTVGNKPVAVAQVNSEDFDFPILGFVYVDNKMRGKNIGTSIVYEITKILLNSGHKLCSLMTDGYNPYSNNAFIKAGYQLYGEYIVRRKFVETV